MQGEPNYNLLALSAALHPSGARLVSALASAQLMKQRQAELERQKALEGQLGTIYGAADLEALERMDTKGFRPEAFRAAHTRRGELLSRSAAEAAAQAEVEDRPGFGIDVPNMGLIEPEPGAVEQAIPFHPDRPERAGRPPRWMPGQAPTTTRLPGELTEGYPGPVRAPDISVQGRAFPPTIGAPEGPIPEGPAAVSSIPVPGAVAPTTDISVPPTYRPPRTREELYGALSKRDRARLLEATAFKELPPDLAAQQAANAPMPGEAELLAQAEKDLNEWEQSLAPEDRTPEVRTRAKVVRRQIALAKRQPKARKDAMDDVHSLVNSVTAGKQFREREARFASQAEAAEVRAADAERRFQETAQRIAQAQTGTERARRIDDLRQEIKTLELEVQDADSAARTARGQPNGPELARAAEVLRQALVKMKSAYREMLMPSPRAGSGPIAPPPTATPPVAGPVTAPSTQQPIVDYDPKTDSLVPRR